MRGQYALLAFGVLVCLIGAFKMFSGGILGENTTGIATVIGIVGIGIIACTQKNGEITEHKRMMP